jgi:hypothetical protein
MNFLLKTLKAIGYGVVFLLSLLLFIRLTFDLNQYIPQVEDRVSNQIGAALKLNELNFVGLFDLHLKQATLTFPPDSDYEDKRKAFQDYLKAKKTAKESNALPPKKVPPPPYPSEVCLNDTTVSVDLIDLIFGHHLKGHGSAIAFDCLDRETLVTEGAENLLSADFKWVKKGNFFKPRPNKNSEIKLNINLSRSLLKSLDFIQKVSPLKIEGDVALRAQLDLVMSSRQQLLLQKTSGEIHLEGGGIKLSEGAINGFEVPPTNVDVIRLDLKIKSGKVELEEVITKGADLKTDITGSITLKKLWKKSSLKAHAALGLEADLIKKIENFSTITTLFKKYFKPMPDGGYKVGILLNGKLNRPRPSARQFSPYSKEGRTKFRQKQADTKQSNRSARGRSRASTRVNKPYNSQSKPTKYAPPPIEPTRKTAPRIKKRRKTSKKARRSKRKKKANKRGRRGQRNNQDHLEELDEDSLVEEEDQDDDEGSEDEGGQEEESDREESDESDDEIAGDESEGGEDEEKAGDDRALEGE